MPSAFENVVKAAFEAFKKEIGKDKTIYVIDIPLVYLFYHVISEKDFSDAFPEGTEQRLDEITSAVPASISGVKKGIERWRGFSAKPEVLAAIRREINPDGKFGPDSLSDPERKTSSIWLNTAIARRGMLLDKLAELVRARPRDSIAITAVIDQLGQQRIPRMTIPKFLGEAIEESRTKIDDFGQG
jgi:hypothetical protein